MSHNHMSLDGEGRAKYAAISIVLRGLNANS
jgi:hypothetical protein